MWTLKTSKDHALASLGSNNIKYKGKLKVKEKKTKSDKYSIADLLQKIFSQ